MQKLRDLMEGWATTIAAVIAWQIIAGYVYPHFINSTSQNVFPAPVSIAATAWTFLRNGELIRDAGASLVRVLVGFGLACAIGIPIGLSMGAWRWWRREMMLVVEVLRPIPPFAWIPLALTWFGVSNAESIFVIVLTAAFPIIINTVAGIDAVDTLWKRSALCLGADRKRLFLFVVLPASLPQIFVGLRVALGFAWMVLVAAELIGSTSGLGYLILDSQNLGLPSLAFMGMVVVGVLGYCLDWGVRALEKVLVPWRD